MRSICWKGAFPLTWPKDEEETMYRPPGVMKLVLNFSSNHCRQKAASSQIIIALLFGRRSRVENVHSSNGCLCEKMLFSYQPVFI